MITVLLLENEVEINFVFQIELEQILGLNQDLAPSSYTEAGNNKNKVIAKYFFIFFSKLEFKLNLSFEHSAWRC